MTKVPLAGVDVDVLVAADSDEVSATELGIFSATKAAIGSMVASNNFSERRQTL
jgi:hypothetical protein